MDRYIIQYPNEKLNQKCEEVENFNKAKLIVEKLKETAFNIRSNIYSYPRGFEIAAPQIGVQCNIILLQGDYSINPSLIESIAMVNPEIIEEKNFFFNWEDCLSIDNMRACVKRSNQVKVRFQDLKGDFFEKVFTGNIACDIQHGIDHLNGKLYFDREIKYFIPLQIYRPLKDEGLSVLNNFATLNYNVFRSEQNYSLSEMKKYNLIHPKQCVKLSDE